MKIETERLENCQVALTIEIDEERTEQALRNAARRISQRAKIPGFRPGKAPYNVVVRRLGKEFLYQEVVDELGDSIYKEALEEAGLEPFGQATLTDYQIEPLVLKLVVPIAPVVELGDYRQMRLEPEEETAREEEMDEALRRIQEQNTLWEPVKRPAQWSDLAIVDIEGTVKGELVIGNKGRELILEADSPHPLPGFSEKLLGMTIDEQREFTLTYPEDSENKKLAGQQAHFKVHLQELKEQVVPGMDDDLARTVGDYETLEDLKAELRRDLQAKAEERFATRALTALVERSKIEFPSLLLEREIDDWLKDLDLGLKKQGLNLDNYLQMRKLTKEEFRKEISPEVEERLKRSLALGKFVELEGLDIESDERVSEALKRLAAVARGELAEEAEALPEEEAESTNQQVVENGQESRPLEFSQNPKDLIELEQKE